jgi:hypothetical protein
LRDATTGRRLGRSHDDLSLTAEGNMNRLTVLGAAMPMVRVDAESAGFGFKPAGPIVHLLHIAEGVVAPESRFVAGLDWR